MAKSLYVCEGAKINQRVQPKNGTTVREDNQGRNAKGNAKTGGDEPTSFNARSGGVL